MTIQTEKLQQETEHLRYSISNLVNDFIEKYPDFLVVVETTHERLNTSDCQPATIIQNIEVTLKLN